LSTDQPLKLRPLVGGQSNDIEVVLVDHLHRIHDFRVDIQVDEFRLLIVIVVSVAKPFLHF
jgi:hypothetical protein